MVPSKLLIAPSSFWLSGPRDCLTTKAHWTSSRIHQAALNQMESKYLLIVPTESFFGFYICPVYTSSDCVVRSQYAQYQVYKFPLNVSVDDYGHGYNPVFSPHGGSVIPTSIQLSSARLTSAGAIGMAANGVIYSTLLLIILQNVSLFSRLFRCLYIQVTTMLTMW